jgi:hypothetical protein
VDHRRGDYFCYRFLDGGYVGKNRQSGTFISVGYITKVRSKFIKLKLLGFCFSLNTLHSIDVSIWNIILEFPMVMVLRTVKEL